MTGFDFVFALFSLVLGLAVAEVLGGFANVMKLHAAARAGKARDVRVGWLVPLLGVLVTTNQLSFWIFAYGVRETLPFSYITLLGVLVVVGAYYLFSALIFPDDPADWPDFDLWYDQNNRFILGGLFAINLVMHIVSARYRPPPTAAQLAQRAAMGDVVWLLVAGAFIELLVLVVLVFVKGRRLNAALLATATFLTVAMAGIAAAYGGFT
ncbi:hypothetical protein JW805_05300 [Roseomonas aeriglobus]|nr:hypothetical protein [Roseomonas aeriglobus]